MFPRKSLNIIFGVLLACGAPALAQTPTPSPAAPDRPLRERSEPFSRRGERRGGHEGMRHRGGMGHLIRELDLTATQREQARAIMQRRLAGTKSQREELFQLREKRIAGALTADDEARAKTLRQQMHASMAGIQEEMAGILTAEQKAKLEQLKQERKAKFEERMKDRRERLNKSPQ